MSDDTVQIQFSAQIAGAIAAINEIKEGIAGIADPIAGVIGAFQSLGEAAIGAFAVEQVANYIDRITDLGEQAVRAGELTGLTAEQFQTLGFAMKMTGGNAESVDMMMMRLERNIENARSGAGPAYDAFQKLGLSLEDLKNKSPYALIEQMADGFRQLKDPVEASAIAMAAGGRGFGQMLAALKDGSAGLEEFRQKLESTNSMLNDAQAESFAKMHQSMTELGQATQGLGVQLVRVLQPDIEIIVGGLKDLIEGLSGALKAIADFAHVLEGVLDQALAATIDDFLRLGITIKGEFKAAMDYAHGNFSQAKTDLDEMDKALIKEQDDYLALSKKIWDAVAAANAWGEAGKKAAATGGGGTLGAPTAPDNSLALDNIKTEEQIAKAHLATKIALLQQEAAYHNITKQQEIEQEKQAVDAEFAIDQKALEEKLALYKEGTADYDQTLNQMDVLDAQHTAKIAQLDVKMAQANQQSSQQTYKAWMMALQPIESAFDTMLTGVLQGTQTLSQAMAKAFDNMAVSIIESIAKVIAEWLVFEAVTMGQGTWSQFAAMQGSGGGGGGFLGGIGKILSFDVGTGYVPQTGLAMIHQGEIILPPDISAQVRSGQATIGQPGGFGGSSISGGNSLSINVTALDSKSVITALNSPQVMSALTKNLGTYYANNPSTRGSY